MFADDIVAFIRRQEQPDLSATFDFLPDMPDRHVMARVYATPVLRDGTVTRHMQVQVRSDSAADALALAWRLAWALDSYVDDDGEQQEEAMVNLTTDRCMLCWPTARPKLLTRDAKNRSVYYFEVALTGDDAP